MAETPQEIAAFARKRAGRSLRVEKKAFEQYKKAIKRLWGIYEDSPTIREMNNAATSMARVKGGSNSLEKIAKKIEKPGMPKLLVDSVQDQFKSIKRAINKNLGKAFEHGRNATAGAMRSLRRDDFDFAKKNKLGKPFHVGAEGIDTLRRDVAPSVGKATMNLSNIKYKAALARAARGLSGTGFAMGAFPDFAYRGRDIYEAEERKKRERWNPSSEFGR